MLMPCGFSFCVPSGVGTGPKRLILEHMRHFRYLSSLRSNVLILDMVHLAGYSGGAILFVMDMTIQGHQELNS